MVPLIEERKAYYKTTAPSSVSSAFQILTHKQAIEDARKGIENGKAKKYWIVQIIEVVEPAQTPVHVTPYRPEE